MPSTTVTGQEVWARYKSVDLKPFTIKCIACRAMLGRDSPAPHYLKLEEGDIEIFIPICTACFESFVKFAIQDLKTIGDMNDVKGEPVKAKEVKKEGAA